MLGSSISRNSLLLALFAVATTLLIAATFLGTRDMIADQKRMAEERAVLLCLLVKIFGYDILVGEAWVVLTVAALASALPITPGALGVREAAVVAVLVPFGVDYHVALLAGLVMRLANVGAAALGAMLLPGGRRPDYPAKDAPGG